MEISKAIEKIELIIRDLFDDDKIEITETTVAADIEYWDSLNNIRVVVAVEKEFGIRFSMTEVERFNNVGEMASAILEKL